MRSTNRRLCCCWLMSPVCHDNESTEHSNWNDNDRSFSIDIFKNQNVQVFHLTAVQDATVNSHYPKLVRELLRQKVNFSFLLEHVIELIVLKERLSSVAIDNFCIVGKKSKMENENLQRINFRIPTLKYRNLSSFTSDYFPPLPSGTSAIINTQPGKMQGDPWKINANSRPKWPFADFLRHKK